MLDGWNVGKSSQRHARSQHDATFRLSILPTFQLRYSHQRNHRLRLLLPSLHIRVQVRPSSDVARVGAGVGLHRDRFLERARLQVPERREPQHQCLVPPAPPAAPAAFCRSLPPTAVPSPPSQGGGTRVGSGHGISGKRAGPKRGSSPFCLRRRALNTFSGVIGTSSMRTPTASYTAFATAGGTGNKGPCPASLAPNGPSGSAPSTRIVWISGVSSVVGLL